ncbi:MAG: beta-ketoacyl synthase N-terminal-like domain-containing protein, partial [Flavobacterium sp.]
MGTDVISVVAIGSFSPLGDNPSDVWAQYQSGKTLLTELTAIDSKTFGGVLPVALSEKAERLKKSNPHYKNLDKSVLYAILASRSAIAQSGWDNALNVGVNIGSSRGATDLFEQYHSE